MKILMLGWEYPPAISGGLGIASQGLAKALAEAGHQVTFLLPKLPAKHNEKNVQLIDVSTIEPDIEFWSEEKSEQEHIRYLEIGSRLIPYLGWEFFEEEKSTTVERKVTTYHESFKLLDQIILTGTYGDSLMDEISKFAMMAVQIASQGEYEVVHCHDWMTFKAGELISQQLQIPFVAHFHSIESERNGFHGHPQIQAIEKTATKQAQLIVAVSKSTALHIERDYRFSTKKIAVLPNGYNGIKSRKQSKSTSYSIGFVGRLTDQKNPRKFLELARLLASERKDVNFIIVGDGHLMEDVRNLVRHYNLEDRVKLTGFLSHEEALTEIAKMDLLLVTSNAEPFGLVPLEAIRSGVAVLTSQGCGLANFVPSLKQLPLWDTYGWTQEINHLLDNEVYRNGYLAKCLNDSNSLSWTNVAVKMTDYYKTLNH